jgi:hypothetical protein
MVAGSKRKILDGQGMPMVVLSFYGSFHPYNHGNFSM